jgi:hypothetical protein
MTVVSKKWNQITSLLRYKSNLFNETYKKISNFYVSTGIGYERGIENVWGKATLKGYFQTWKYVRALEQKSDLRLKIKNPSIWFTRLIAIAEESAPIMIHVRQGDYRDDVNSFIGVLGPNYYKNAISEVRATGINSSIWVFSDEIESAKKLLSFHDDENVFWIVAPEGTDPAEELAIMQFGGAHIIANSTFSWWGAYLSRSTKIVIAPGSWFKDLEEPLDLIPPEWKRIKNDWL